MLNIREDQQNVLGHTAQLHFEDEMLAHCKDFSPQLCETLDDTQLRIAILRAIENAQQYGLTNRGPVRLYIEMTMLFGSDFDSDPLYPWAHKVLANEEIDVQSDKADLLFEKTLEYLDSVVGPDDTFAIQALQRISAFAQTTPAYSTHDYLSSMLHDISMLYPEKANYIGNVKLESMIRKGASKSSAYGMTNPNDWVVITLLMFAFGHGCDHDPFYPWISDTLTDEKITDSEKRIKRLRKKSITWLNQVIDWQTKGPHA